MKTSSVGYLLVLEDSDEDFDTIVTAARGSEMQHTIRRAVNGDECVELLSDWVEAEHCRPILALLDLNTPQGDGRYALKALRKDERFRTMPIVILSTSANPKDLDYCYEEGANAYHVKPVDYPSHIQTLVQIFDYWLRGVILPATP